MTAYWSAVPIERQRVVADVLREIDRQDEKWGEQNPPDFAGLEPTLRAEYHGIPTETTAKYLCEVRQATGEVTWTDVLVEEVAEAVGCGDRYSLRAELVQVAAVVHQWIAALDRRIDSTESVLQQEEWDDRLRVQKGMV